MSSENMEYDNIFDWTAKGNLKKNVLNTVKKNRWQGIENNTKLLTVEEDDNEVEIHKNVETLSITAWKKDKEKEDKEYEEEEVSESEDKMKTDNMTSLKETVEEVKKDASANERKQKNTLKDMYNEKGILVFNFRFGEKAERKEVSYIKEKKRKVFVVYLYVETIRKKKIRTA